ncbi:uncharacterized protein N7506_009652 [Penicillium brevicompactum]|uniref:uncharacterized protein n=1 Tax=Penicillium brevicompactum TaxID=5074 RepID=UPI0025421786|nr:uncharacterized protein N7506_009652 [Penicillium brevicompactum]KAJ5326550.1 hypothetical protein N7506_009652 [Penicillium brevicompactum]
MASCSKRDPTMSSSMNEADRVEQLLKEDGLTTWGFGIFRCTTYHNAALERGSGRSEYQRCDERQL